MTAPVHAQNVVFDLRKEINKDGNWQSEFTFYLPAARTNVLKLSPLHTMCEQCNILGAKVDIFNCSVTDIKVTIWDVLKQPRIIMLCVAASIRHCGGMCFAYNCDLYYQQYFPDYDLGWWLFVVTVGIGSIGYFPQRAYIALMLFTACAISYMLRVNMSINIIAMAKEETKNSTDFVPACKAAFLANLTLQDEAEEKFDKLTASQKIDEDKRYDWDPQIQALILGAYFWGQIVSCAPGGLVAERFGATRTVFISTIAASVCTFFIPMAAMLHWSVVWLLRFVTGVMGGVVYPSLHCLISRWAPPEEKGKFIGALLGGSLGTVLTWPLLGIIIEKCGWPASFFIPSAIALLWSLLWYYVVSDSPSESKWISDGERSHIQSSLKGLSSKEKSLPPYKEIFTSIAVWAFIMSHFGNSWGLFFLMTSGPKYMSTILGFNLSSSGFLSAMPYMARMIFGFIFGFFGDIIRKNNWMAPTVIRKSFTSFSHIIPGIFLLLLTTTECNIIWTVTLITFSLGINGASSITNLANAQDLAPAYAGSLYGIANTIGGTTGFISPIITGYLTKEQNGIDQWRIIFFIGGSVYILSGIVFLLFGSGENQNFNSSSNSQKKAKTSGIDNTAFENDESKNSTTKI